MWERKPMLDDVYNEMHGIKPEVYYNIINATNYQVKLVKDGKEVILTEQMKGGLPESVTFEYNGEKKEVKRIYNGEVEANKIFKGE